MNKIAMSILTIFTTVSAFAADVGELAPTGVMVQHLFSDGTETNQDLLVFEKDKGKIMLEFFQTTCSACTENKPIFLQLANEHAQKVTFKYVGIDKKESVLRSYYQQNRTDFQFPYVLDNLRAATKSFKIAVTPTSFIIDSTGKILYRHEGTFENADLKEIREILNQ